MLIIDFFRSKFVKNLLLCAVSTAILFIGFFSNGWKVADQKWFVNHQRDMESHIIGRIVQSNQEGLFSYGGLTGLGSRNKVPVDYFDRPFDFQYAAHFFGLKFGAYTTYNSQIGGQGMLFSILDKIIPLPAPKKLPIYHALTALLSALTISFILLWFYWELGLFVCISVLASVIFSQWLVVFGKNLWWVMWAFYLPMVLIMHYLKRYRTATAWNFKIFGSLVFLAVLIKCFFNGYEYITTTLVMMMVPFVYYCVLDKLELRTILGGVLTAVISSFFAISLTLCILCIQIASVEGGFSKGVEHIVYSLQKRTYGGGNHAFSPQVLTSLDASTTEVVNDYLQGTFFDLNNYFSSSNSFISRSIFNVSYVNLIGLFLLISAYLTIRRYIPVAKKEWQTDSALTIATWFSAAAPLSWFIFFKAHSYIHTHMNYIVWQMPFTMFGFAVCGLGAKRALSDLIYLTNSFRGHH